MASCVYYALMYNIINNATKSKRELGYCGGRIEERKVQGSLQKALGFANPTMELLSSCWCGLGVAGLVLGPEFVVWGGLGG